MAHTASRRVIGLVLLAAAAAGVFPPAATADGARRGAGGNTASSLLYATLFGVAATSGGNVWAVGSGDSGALIEHWNGTRWSGITFG